MVSAMHKNPRTPETWNDASTFFHALNDEDAPSKEILTLDKLERILTHLQVHIHKSTEDPGKKTQQSQTENQRNLVSSVISPGNPGNVIQNPKSKITNALIQETFKKHKNIQGTLEKQFNKYQWSKNRQKISTHINALIQETA